MFPLKVRDFVKGLTRLTTNNELQWDYLYHEDKAIASGPLFHVELRYWFNTEMERPEFFLDYTPAKSAQSHRFSTVMGETDFEIAAELYDMARASKLSFPSL
ncbi:hypothetical protein [Achromobacter xylosoxidans]|uniref:hypothetical protein n=1 Tax=Alcaligenes xylosoxydans xylosoxydans TaxID=85698 RepID=UPI001F148200|nr:hypothetical protein [Achromobacter xylosoxidans]